MSIDTLCGLYSLGGLAVGMVVMWLTMTHLNTMENFTKEEVLQAQQIVLDGLTESKKELFEQLLRSNDVGKDVKAMDCFSQELAAANRILLELQNFAVNEEMDAWELGDEAKEVYDKVKNHF